MQLEERHYSVLLVTSSQKLIDTIRPLLLERMSANILAASSAAEARQKLLENTVDIVIINAPLPDESGMRLAVDCAAGKPVVCMLMAPSNVYDSLDQPLSARGIFVLQKPTSSSMLSQGLRWLMSARESLRGMETKAVSIEEKMEQIRLVNRAKWALIEQLHMTEAEAHHYIEKQAMDKSMTKKAVAERILKVYGNYG